MALYILCVHELGLAGHNFKDIKEHVIGDNIGGGIGDVVRDVIGDVIWERGVGQQPRPRPISAHGPLSSIWHMPYIPHNIPYNILRHIPISLYYIPDNISYNIPFLHLL